MPIYVYECSRCNAQFEEFHNISEENTGKSSCVRCGNVSFKIPAPFALNIFKQRKFADGTKTPDNVRTFKQEKEWLKSQGITYDAPTGKEKKYRREERKRKSETAIQIAFKDALNKVDQGFKFNKPLKQRETKSAIKNWS